jgi:alkylation response protein AidB-like acyl-CoA dehydrogenase
MRFDLNEDQRAIAQTVDDLLSRKFPLTAIRPVVDGEASADTVFEEFHAALASMGVFGLVVPEELGGAGLALLDAAVVAERLGYGAAPSPLLGPVLTALALVHAGAAEQQATWLPGIADGTVRAGYATVASGGDGDLAGVNAWVLTDGRPLDLILVSHPAGLSLVEGGAAGLTVEPLSGIDRTRPLVDVRFDGVAHDPLPGGAEQRDRIRDAGRVLLAADAFGGGSRCVDLAVAYAKIREQFGRPIGSFQAVKHQLADMDIAIEPAQGLYWYAAHAFDHVPDDSTEFAGLAKAHLTERYVEVARRLVEVYGGFGYTWECDAHIFLKRSAVDRVQLGTPRAIRAELAAATDW